MKFTRGRIAVVGAGLLTLAGAAVFAVTSAAADPAGWTSTISALPAAPLSARRDVAAVWTGAEMLVWGGFAGNQAAERYFADGAAYDPGKSRWRTLPAAPLAARSEAQAVWTGTEMIVWGGADARHSPKGVTDGAAYNPKTNRWRRIAAAPGTGRTGGQTLMTAGRMVVFGGSGVTGADAAKTILTYDPRADRWTSFARPQRVVAAAATGSTLFLAEFDDHSRVSVAQVGLDGSELVRGPAIEQVADRVGLTVDSGTAYLIVTDSEQKTRVHAGAITDGMAPAAWTEKKTSAEAEAPYQIYTGYSGLITALSPELLLMSARPEITVLNSRTGRVLLTESTWEAAKFCGESGALIWTGSQLLNWGGQTCRPNGPALTAEGIAVAVHP
ncbi:hypothetical protein [Actinoplanes sp. NPDC026619]|uniref:Kelch repeat-containing protein n=1 Tax=Actinoplanes sp. NPDC026619 TaxID=3155798 RepID=UPI0033E7A7C8